MTRIKPFDRVDEIDDFFKRLFVRSLRLEFGDAPQANPGPETSTTGETRV